MKTITLKTGEILVIREAVIADAAEMIAHVKKVGDESDFLTFEGSQFNKTISEEEDIINIHRDAPNQIFLLAEIDNNIIGMLNVTAKQKPRIQHVGEFGVSVSKSNWNKGIGRHLIMNMIEWAEMNPMIKKLNLMVVENNIAAIELYKKLGFEEEGRLRKDFFIKGQYLDGVIMGMIID